MPHGFKHGTGYNSDGNGFVSESPNTHVFMHRDGPVQPVQIEGATQAKPAVDSEDRAGSAGVAKVAPTKRSVATVGGGVWTRSPPAAAYVRAPEDSPVAHGAAPAPHLPDAAESAVGRATRNSQLSSAYPVLCGLVPGGPGSCPSLPSGAPPPLGFGAFLGASSWIHNTSDAAIPCRVPAAQPPLVDVADPVIRLLLQGTLHVLEKRAKAAMGPVPIHRLRQLLNAEWPRFLQDVDDAVSLFKKWPQYVTVCSDGPHPTVAAL